MSITKLYAGVEGDPLNSSGTQIRDTVNQLIDVHVNSLKSLPNSPQTDTVYNVIGFYAGSTVGGGKLVWQPSASKSLHNGVTYYAPEAIAAWAGTQADIATLLNWTGAGNGVWVRIEVDTVLFEMAGAILDANPTTGTGTDNTLSVNKTFLTGLPVYFSNGYCKLTNQVNMLTHQFMRGSGRTTSMFVIGTDFNLSAGCVLRLGLSEPGAQAQDLGFSFVQADQGVRASCTQYPWAIDASNMPRFILDNIRIEGAWNGVKATGNTGGAGVGFMEIGALNIGFEVDGALDFFHVQTLHFWPFGFSTKTTLLNGVYYDGVGTSLKFGLCDGADFGTVSMFRTKMEVTLNATQGISNSFEKIHLDGDGARLLINGGVNAIAQVYSTKSSGSTASAISVTGGLTTISDAQILGDNYGNDISVAGGTLRISGGTALWNNSGFSKAVVSAGQLHIDSMKIRNAPTTMYTAPFAAQSGTGELIFRDNLFDLTTTGSGIAVSYATDLRGNYCLNNRLSGYTAVNPTNGALGVYQGPINYTPVIKGTTTEGTATYSVQTGKAEHLNERLVAFTASVTYSGHTGAGGTLLSLLHSLSDFGQRVPLNVYASDITYGAGKQLVGFCGQSGNNAAIRAIDPSGGVALEFFDTAGTINISGFYRRA